MCRLFGFRSIINSQVHSSLVQADNALAEQSTKHPDGWGVCYYREETPHIIKSNDCAIENNIFQKLSGVVTSKTVLAHIRKATQGIHSFLNTHPFQYGKWVFAHNGNIKNFSLHKDKLEKLIDTELKRFLLGSTDSEIIFYIILSQIKMVYPLNQPSIPLKDLKSCIETAVNKITKICGPLTDSDDPTPTENYLTFILTSGPIITAFHGGQKLNYCTYKKSCPDKDSCASYSLRCESPPQKDMKVSHLILSSEITTSNENVWHKMKIGDFIAADESMTLFQDKIKVDTIKA